MRERRLMTELTDQQVLMSTFQVCAPPPLNFFAGTLVTTLLLALSKDGIALVRNSAGCNNTGAQERVKPFALKTLGGIMLRSGGCVTPSAATSETN